MPSRIMDKLFPAEMLSKEEQRACERYVRTFNEPPVWVASAPGRVNLIGEFTDYNDGYVLPMAIEYRTAIAAAPNGTSKMSLNSEMVRRTDSFDLSPPLSPTSQHAWTNYARGVVQGFIEAGHQTCGFNAMVCSSVPVGSGLSSSAALECAFLALLEGLNGVRMNSLDKVLLCQNAEHRFAGVSCGIMDPFISIHGRSGHAVLLDCRSRHSQWVPFDDPDVEILIVNTNVRHQLATSEYGDRRHKCLEAARVIGVPSLRDAIVSDLGMLASRVDDLTWRCAKHVISEIDRTESAVECLVERNWTEFGQLMNASHESLRDDFRVSCPELDVVTDIASKIGPAGGVFGARMTGGGFGGCAIALVKSEAREAIAAEINTRYHRRTGIEPALFVSRPAGGAHVIRV